MGHDVIDCPDCGRWIMEGHRDWKCKCGWYMSAEIKESEQPDRKIKSIKKKIIKSKVKQYE